jgi:hypothetical protein
MHRINSLYSSFGLFTDGPPGTIVSADWLNAIQEEICYVITQAGYDISPVTNDSFQQLFAAIHALIVASSTPIGFYGTYGGATAPPGWFLCDGTGYSTTGIGAALFAIIGYTFGGAGATFNVPNIANNIIKYA